MIRVVKLVVKLWILVCHYISKDERDLKCTGCHLNFVNYTQ
uniref:Uncharacterized protein n=1 Tax=Anguilla anguilla TaxID=7936 RepID=A0A0E9T5T7_ANGAN